MHGLTTRRYGEVVRELEQAYGIEKSTVSEHFVEASRRHLEKLQRRHFGEDVFCAMMSGAGVLTKSALGTDKVRDGLPLRPSRTIPRTVGHACSSIQNEVSAKKVATTRCCPSWGARKDNDRAHGPDRWEARRCQPN